MYNLQDLKKNKKNDVRILQRNSKSSMNNINGRMQSSECKTNRYATEKTENCCQKSTGTTLRMSLKVFDENDLPYELLLTTRQKQSQEMHLITIC